MAKQQSTLVQLADHQPLQTQLAEVHQAHDGVASQVAIGNQIREVTGHGRSLAAVYPGDQVTVLVNQQHCLITEVIDGPEHKASQFFKVDHGVAKLEGIKALSMETEQGKLVIDLKGRVFLEGKAIYSVAEEDHTIVGHPIRLN